MATSRRKFLAGIGANLERASERPLGMSEDPSAYACRPTTQAAEGIPRLRWTLDEFERLGDLGVFTEDDRIELIEGELVPMSPKGNRHERVRGAILNWLRRNLPDECDLHVAPGWRVAGSYCEPDFLIAPAGCDPTSVPPGEVALLIEVADTSLKKDTVTKAGLYGRVGVGEYWVVNARSLSTKIHRERSARGYASRANIAQNRALTSLAIPSLTIRLGDLDLR